MNSEFLNSKSFSPRENILVIIYLQMSFVQLVIIEFWSKTVAQCRNDTTKKRLMIIIIIRSREVWQNLSAVEKQRKKKKRSGRKRKRCVSGRKISMIRRGLVRYVWHYALILYLYIYKIKYVYNLLAFPGWPPPSHLSFAPKAARLYCCFALVLVYKIVTFFSLFLLFGSFFYYFYRNMSPSTFTTIELFISNKKNVKHTYLLHV